MPIATPFSRPLYVMLKPAGARCNLDCSYCYYKEKAELYPSGGDTPAAQPPILSDALLETFVKEYIAAQDVPQVLFTWHGGEPLLRPLSFYRKALELQQQYARGRQVDNVIQTNGTLLSEEWCAFFRDNNFLVGISIDGPQPLHDACRRTATGQLSFQRVLRGIDLLNRYGVEWNAMAVVNSLNAERPIDFYRFFRDIGCHYIQFAPVVERRTPLLPPPLGLMAVEEQGNRTSCTGKGTPAGCAFFSDADACRSQLTDESVSPQQWGDFLCAVFSEWVKRDVGKYFVQLFDATLANWCGEPPGVCTMSAECGNVGVMEHNGDVYSCDHFVFPPFRLGNIRRQTVGELMYSRRQQKFARMKRHMLPQQCQECRFLFACHGECPKNRLLTDCYGQPGLNYLCSGFRRFFEHSAPYMDRMRWLLSQGLPPARLSQ